MTRDELLKALKEATAEDRTSIVAELLSDNEMVAAVLPMVNERGTRLLTKEEHDSLVKNKAIPNALKNKVARSEYEELQAKLDRLTRELEEAKKKKPDPKIEEEIKAKLQEYEGKINGLKELLEKEKADRQAVEAQRVQDRFHSALDDRLIELGVPSGRKLRQARAAILQDHPNLSHKDDNGKSRIVALDSTKEVELDTDKILSGWAKENAHFLNPKAPGGGSESAGPTGSPPKQDPTEGMSPLEMMNYGRKKEGNVGL